MKENVRKYERFTQRLTLISNVEQSWGKFSEECLLKL